MCSHHMPLAQARAVSAGIPAKALDKRLPTGAQADVCPPSLTSRKPEPNTVLSISRPISPRIRFASRLRCRCGGAKNSRRATATTSEISTSTEKISRNQPTTLTSSG